MTFSVSNGGSDGCRSSRRFGQEEQSDRFHRALEPSPPGIGNSVQS
ncbi:hypothetical protein [Nostoc sp. UHCC 0252]|nr:hypothetical protein [Nostoc sp. UHCC 0252]MEA5605813.1 hypothetical protein [Nostoc sp. UHCC 0252]